jgi:acyl-coenzyme A synthetase/AMP-(fatty) acid ligase
MSLSRGSWPRNIGLLLDHHAGAQRPVFHLDKPFDIAPDGGTRYTVAGLAELVAQTSGALHAAGLRPGGRLAIVKDNGFDFALLAAAAARIGALPAMISTSIRPEALATMLDRLDPSVLVASPGVFTAAARQGCQLPGPGVRSITLGDGPDIPRGAVDLAELRGSPVPPAAPVRDDEPMICTHTSGTTGVPKFVVHSANTAVGVNSKLETAHIPFLSMRADDVFTLCVAFMHIRSITWLAGQMRRPPGTSVIVADSDPASVAATLRAHPPTVLEACPNIFLRWEQLPVSHPELFERCRAYVSTFDAIHPRTVRTFLAASKRRGAIWGQSWGQSEVGPVTLGVYSRRSVRKAHDQATAITSDVGRPVPFIIRTRIVDPETRKPVRRGREGLILVRTRGLCLGYLGEDDRHKAKRWGDWWNTGDLGLRTRGGHVRIRDREVDIIPDGSGLHTESVLLDRIPDATEVIVLGVPGRKPIPVISTQSGALDPATWRTAAEGLPALENPILISWDSFPRTATWKVRRPELRRQLLDTAQTFGTGRWT